MAWKVHLLTEEEQRAYFDGKYTPKVGDMWFSKWRLEDMPHFISPYYFQHWASKRPPLDIALPSSEGWGYVQHCIDMRTISNGVPNENGWVVTGEPENITVSPSINLVGIYHGWLQNGVLSEDCEGRVYKPR